MTAHAEPPTYDAKSLRERLNKSASHKKTINERLKAAQGNTKTLQLLREGDINYKLPNGSYVIGMLLPNGKVAPAHIRHGRRYPACVTVDYKLVQGLWNEKRQVITCALSQSELAFIGENGASNIAAAQVSSIESEDVEETAKANKYEEINNSDSGDAPGKKSEVQNQETKLRSNKYSSASKSSKTYAKKSGKGSNSSPPTPSVNTHIYVPPPRNSASSKAVAGVIKIDRSKFGIPIGTWVKAELMRPVSSAETGLIEFILTEGIEGRFRSFPAGTVLFASKNINKDNKRMESITQLAKLPDDEEVKVSARIYSLDKSAGMSGTLIRDREGELTESTSRATLNALSASIPDASSIAGAAIESITSDTIDREGDYLDRVPGAIIKVNPQAVLVKISASF